MLGIKNKIKIKHAQNHRSLLFCGGAVTKNLQLLRSTDAEQRNVAFCFPWKRKPAAYEKH